MIAEQTPDMMGAYSVDEFHDKDAAAIRNGSMVVVSITLENRHGPGDWAAKAEKINFTVPPDAVGEYPHFEEIADEQTRFWAADMWGATVEVPAGAKARFGRPMTPCTVVETVPYDLGRRRTGYVIVRGMGGERRRVSAEKVAFETDEA